VYLDVLVFHIIDESSATLSLTILDRHERTYIPLNHKQGIPFFFLAENA